MAYQILPRGEMQKVRALEGMGAAADAERHAAEVEWFTIHWYLMGLRDPYVRDWQAGDVYFSHEDEDALHFRFEKVLSLYRAELSRWMRSNVLPAAEADGYSLDASRDAGISHATLRWMTGGLPNEQIKSQFLQLLLKYGTGAVLHWRKGTGSTIRERTVLSAVPPWELRAYPAEVQTLGDVRAVGRDRWVPLEWLQQVLTLPRDESKLQVEEYPWGTAPSEYSVLGEHGGSAGSAGGMRSAGSMELYEKPESGWASNQGKGKKGKLTQSWVRLEEWWHFGSTPWTLAGYTAKVGEALPIAEEYDEEVPCPLGVGRYTPVGGFYGRSYIGPQLGLNDQIERMLARQFQMVQDADEYGAIVISSTSGINPDDLKKRARRKILVANPDPLVPNFQPFVLQPANTGDLPAKIAALGLQLHEDLAGQGPLERGEAPGRVDSAAGLGFIFETGSMSEGITANEIASAYGTVYRHMLHAARIEAEGASPFTVFRLPVLDDRMMGVQVNPDGTIGLSNNPIPRAEGVHIGIVEQMPVNKQRLREEAVRMLQFGVITPLEFRILNYREELGFPIVNRSEWEAYRRAIFQMLVLFNDGKTPGAAITNMGEQTTVSLMVCLQTMNSVEYALASEEVRWAFEFWLQNLQQGAGQRFPEQLPYAEDGAAMQAQAMKAGGGGASGGGMNQAGQGGRQARSRSAPAAA